MVRAAKKESLKSPKKECLLSHEIFVANKQPSSFERGNIAWEASTLPLSYTRKGVFILA